MVVIGGLVAVVVLVFGGYMWAGGSLSVILHAMPYEGMMIGGGAIGSFVVANSLPVIRKTGAGLVRAIRGARWSRQDHGDMLRLLVELGKLQRESAVKLEPHIETPSQSDIFGRYPRLRDDADALAMIRDGFRLVSMEYDDPSKIDTVLSKRIEKVRADRLSPVVALETMADALPAIGIVAAVLGVINSLGAVDESPAVLGKKIGGALVGTFMGVFLAYCFVSPLATRLRTTEEQDIQLLHVVREFFVAMTDGVAPNVCAEIARTAIPRSIEPDFDEVEQLTRELRGTA